MDAPAGETHNPVWARDFNQPRERREEEDMWQVHAAFRFGYHRTPELDVTPALGVALVVAFTALIIHTGL
jgi:hypothetical protein